MQLGIASDHGGYQLKEAIKKHFTAIDWQDYGTSSDESVDYPDLVAPLARDIQQGKLPRAIILCGSGIGASIMANRFRGVRAALCHDVYTAEMCRKHNDANIMALGGRVVSEELAMQMIEAFLATGFEGGRHERRVKKLDELAG